MNVYLMTREDLGRVLPPGELDKKHERYRGRIQLIYDIRYERAGTANGFALLYLLDSQ